MQSTRTPVSPFTNKRLKRVCKYGNASLYQCKATGFLCSHPLPTAAELDEYYRETYFIGDRYELDTISDESPVWKTWIRRLDTIEKYRPAVRRPKLLDIGAGTGAFCQIAERKNWQVSCVEFSEAGRQAIRNRVKTLHKIADHFPSESLASETFDLITMWAVIEHMPYRPDLFGTLRDSLEPNGVVAFSFPNPITLNRYLFGSNWRYFIPIEHLSFYPPKLFVRLLESAGFEVLAIDSHFSGRAAQDGLNRSRLLKSLPKKVTNGLSRVIQRINQPIFHGDTLEVIGRKVAGNP